MKNRGRKYQKSKYNIYNDKYNHFPHPVSVSSLLISVEGKKLWEMVGSSVILVFEFCLHPKIMILAVVSNFQTSRCHIANTGCNLRKQNVHHCIMIEKYRRLQWTECVDGMGDKKYVQNFSVECSWETKKKMGSLTLGLIL
jgi:hypothetical protein